MRKYIYLNYLAFKSCFGSQPRYVFCVFVFFHIFYTSEFRSIFDITMIMSLLLRNGVLLIFVLILVVMFLLFLYFNGEYNLFVTETP